MCVWYTLHCTLHTAQVIVSTYFLPLLFYTTVFFFLIKGLAPPLKQKKKRRKSKKKKKEKIHCIVCSQYKVHFHYYSVHWLALVVTFSTVH